MVTQMALVKWVTAKSQIKTKVVILGKGLVGVAVVIGMGGRKERVGRRE